MVTMGIFRPTGMSEFTGDVFDVLEHFVFQPWNVLRAVCGRQGADPLEVDAERLATVLPQLLDHVCRITDDENRDALERELKLLLAIQPNATAEDLADHEDLDLDIEVLGAVEFDY